MLNSFGDLDAAAAVKAEQVLLGELLGGCSVPVGAHCSRSAGVLTFNAQVTSVDGGQRVTGTVTGTDPEESNRHVRGLQFRICRASLSLLLATSR